MNRDLLTEAIADAKSVKETAIANAKAALEESFTPHLKSMLSAKLEEMDMDEEIEEVNVSEEVVEENEVEEEINLDELLSEIEGEDKDVKESEEIEEIEEVTEAEEDETEEVEDEEAEEATEEEEVDLEDMTEDDLKSFIEDVIKDMVDAGELEAGEEMEDEADMEDMDVDVDMEIEVEDEDEIMEVDAVTKKLRDGASLDSAPRKVGQTTVQEGDEIEEGYGDMADSAGGGLENIVNGLKKLAQAAGPAAAKANAMLKGLAQAAHAVKEEEVELEEVELDEMDELKELRNELNEVNLLNAKLLYTNKIFKAKNLSEDKKRKVLKAFDKAVTVKEAKVIFETLNEGITSSLSRSTSMVNEIKGSASKATGFTSTVKQPIVENAAFTRMQKLAGIIK